MIIGKGGPTDRASIRLATRRNSWIRNVVRQEMPPEVLRASADLFAQHRPNAKLRCASARYNCMALPFASRRTWVAPDALDPMLDLILTDDEYRRIEAHEAELGDLVIYRSTVGEPNVSHVAIVLRVEADLEIAGFRMFVLSKWGQAGEYIHDANDVPVLLGAPAEYWTDRRASS